MYILVQLAHELFIFLYLSNVSLFWTKYQEIFCTLLNLQVLLVGLPLAKPLFAI